jgi:hypothetical protein
MSEHGFLIPDDWDGVTWECISIQWPASEKWRVMLVSLMYLLTRGREWDKGSGTIRDAQAIAWQIFGANVPLNQCGGLDETVTPPPVTHIEYRGGSIIIISEDDMGQVVTEVLLDYLTGELIVKYGMCCEKRFPIVVGETPVDDYGAPTTPPGFPPEFPPDTFDDPDVTYTKCGRVQTLMQRLQAMGQAAWNNRELPSTMANAIRDANPGYSFSMGAVTNLYIVGLKLTAIEALADADIFNDEFFRKWTCYGVEQLDSDSGGFDKTEFFHMVVWPETYAFSNGVPDLDVVVDLTVAQWWATLLQQVLHRERANQIMDEAVGVEGDCLDCQSTPIGTGPTNPLASGYFLGPNLIGIPGKAYVVEDGVAMRFGVRDVMTRPVYGAVIGTQPYEPRTTKRTAWDPVRMGNDVDVSMFPDTSDHLELEGFQDGVPMVAFFDETISAELAAQLGLSLVWKDSGLADNVPFATAGDVIGASLSINNFHDAVPAQLRFIYHETDVFA